MILSHFADSARIRSAKISGELTIEKMKFGERIEADLAKWGKVIRDAKVQVE